MSNFHARRHLLAVLILATTALAAHAQAPDLQARMQAAIANLRTLGGEGLGAWRFQHPAQPGGQNPALDDSSWPQVRPTHQWQGNNTAAWYRIQIAVPDRIGAAPTPGGPLILRVAVDDDGEIYVDGKLAQKFHWDQGKVALTDDARPGQTFFVAVKVINQGGPGALTSASLTWARLEPVSQAALDQASTLQFASALLANQAKPTAAATAAVEASLAALDTSALTASVDDSRAAIEASAKALAPLEPIARQYKLFLVGHAHIDMDWLWLWPETVQVCHDTWWQAVRFMEEFPEFCFSQSQPGAYAAIKQKYPDLFAEMQKYAKQGRWELNTATWVEGDTNMASGEALVRQMLASREFCEKNFGKWTDTLWLPDNFGHAWTIPMIFSDAGIRNFYFMRGGVGLPVFWWQSADGSRILCFNNDSYDRPITPAVLNFPLTVERQVGIKDCMVPYGVGDHGGGPTRHDILEAMALRKRPLAPQIKFATTDEFFQAVRAQKAKLPVVAREMGFVFRGCYTSHSDIKYMNRKLENLLPTAETAAVAAKMMAGRPYSNATFMGAWHNVLFNQFHDILCGSAIHGSYDYSLGLDHDSEVTGKRELNDSLAALGRKMNTSGVGDGMLLWNRLGWARKGTLEAPAPDAAQPGEAMVATGADHVAHAGQVVEMPSADGPRKMLALDATVPACGWAVYHVQAGKTNLHAGEAPAALREDARRVTIDNGLLRIVVDKASGALTSVYDLAAHRELVPEGQKAGQLEILWEHPDGSAWNIGPIAWTKPIAQADSVQVAADGPLVAGVLVKQSWDKSSFTTWIGLRAGARQVDFRLVANWQEIGTQSGGPMLKVAFPTTLASPTFTCQIPFGSVEREADGRDVPSQRWMDLTDVKWTRSGSYKPVTVDLSRYFDQDVFAPAKDPADGDFDSQGVSFPAATFASARDGKMDFRGLPWIAPPTAQGAMNAVRCDGQRIDLPKAEAGGITVFGSSAPSASSGLARILFADGSHSDVNLSFSDWCFGPAPGEEIAVRAPNRMGRTGPVPPECHIFARTLNIPRGKTAVALVLPTAPRLRVMAITLGPGLQAHAIYGAAVLNDCKYGVDAKGSTMRLSLLRSSDNPDPKPDVGVHEINYALVPHEGDWSEGGQVERPAWELNNPLATAEVEPHGGHVPGAGSLVSLAPSNLVLAAVKQAEDGKGLIVRWYETAGRDTTARLRFGFDVASAQVTNAVEVADRGALPVHGREVDVRSPAHRMMTVRIQPGRGSR